MTVYKKTKNGIEGKFWYYNFTLFGKRYNKSTMKESKAEALIVEEKAKAEIKARHARLTEDNASDILVADAITLALMKPSKRSISEKQSERKRKIWCDFTCWLTDFFPKIKLLNKVTRAIAEEYINHIREFGRYNKTISQKGKGSYETSGILAPRTLNIYHKEIQRVFKLLVSDAGLIYNPFEHIPKLNEKTAKREAYSNDELSLIAANLDYDLFCKHLYMLGSGTGMRMGNICLLDWSDVDLRKKIIKCENLKTEGKLTIPILDELYSYLLELEPKTAGYISVGHANRYLNDKGSVSRMFIKFLNSIGITTKVMMKGRSRCSNIKGLHAMRHTFIYRAMVANIPINIIQCIVGHVDDDVTKMYADHVLAEDAQKAMAGFSLNVPIISQRGAVSKPDINSHTLTGVNEQLLEKLSKLSPEKQKQLLDFVS